MPGDLVTTSELVDRLRDAGRGEWTTSSVYSWLKSDNPCPVARRGKPGRDHLFDYDAVCSWLDSRDERASELADPRLEKARQEARLARLKADEMEGALVRADEVGAVLERVIGSARTTMLGWPPRLGRALALTPEQEARVRDEVDDLLRQLASTTVTEDGAVVGSLLEVE